MVSGASSMSLTSPTTRTYESGTVIAGPPGRLGVLAPQVRRGEFHVALSDAQLVFQGAGDVADRGAGGFPAAGEPVEDDALVFLPLTGGAEGQGAEQAVHLLERFRGGGLAVSTRTGG